MIITIQVKNERDGSERALQINVNSEKLKLQTRKKIKIKRGGEKKENI